MSIRIATSYESSNRPRCVVTHTNKPSYFSTEKSYKHLASLLPKLANGLWHFHDVHIVDHHVCIVMAWLRTTWRFGRLHVVLVAPSLEASRMWALYVTGGYQPIESPSSPLPLPPSSVDVQYVPSLNALSLGHWLQRQQLRGDVLVFARSNAHRDDLAMALRIGTLEPVYVITTHVPPRYRQTPRVLVGGPSLDLLLGNQSLDCVQHVVDFGVIRSLGRCRWKDAPITLTMATGRRRMAGRKAKGITLCAYRSDADLDDRPLAQHLLRHDVCVAKLTTTFALWDNADFPIDLGDAIPKRVASVMATLDVHRPVAEMIMNSRSIEAGIGLAVAVACGGGGPFPGVIYDKLRQGDLSVQERQIVQRWATSMRTTMQQVIKETSRVPWNEAATIVGKSYPTVAVNAGRRKLFVDATSGELLRCAFSHTSIKALVYTHRIKNDIGSYVPIPAAHAVLLQRTLLDANAADVHDASDAEVEAFFEQHRIVATIVQGKNLELVSLPSIDVAVAVDRWRRQCMLRKYLEKPLAIPVGTSMHMVFTAGLQVSDVVHDEDVALVKVHRGAFLKNAAPARRVSSGVYLFPSRETALEACRLANGDVQGVQASRLKMSASSVRVEIVIRTYLGRSTGRVTVKGECQAWQHRVDKSWGWAVRGNRICLVPTRFDEFDLGEMLGIDPFRIHIDRSTNIITHLASVAEVVHELGIYASTHRTLRLNDTVIQVSPSQVEDVYQLLVDELPERNNIVDQPLRLFWIVGTRPSPNDFPPSIIHGTFRRDPTDLDRLRSALECTQRLVRSMTPDMVWLPQIRHGYLYPPNVERDGAKFLVYGSPDQRTTAMRALRILAGASKPPVVDQAQYCTICYDNEAGYTLKACGCRFCLVCLSTAFEMKCCDPTFVGLLSCPLCSQRVATDDIMAIVSLPSLHHHALKMARFLSRKRPDLICECPAGCGFLGRTTARGDPAMDCETCGQQWCTLCSRHAGHAQQTHAGFCVKRWDVAFWTEFADEATKAGAKPCPTCGAFVAKDEGCSHMTCVAPHCNTHFCWKCNQAFSHLPTSPPAQGTIIHIDADAVTIAVDPTTWKTPCMTPCPPTVTCKKSFFPQLLLPSHELNVGSRAHVYSYVYDHIDCCMEQT